MGFFGWLRGRNKEDSEYKYTLPSPIREEMLNRGVDPEAFTDEEAKAAGFNPDELRNWMRYGPDTILRKKKK